MMFEPFPMLFSTPMVILKVLLRKATDKGIPVAGSHSLYKLDAFLRLLLI